jgi:hypothetical protein
MSCGRVLLDKLRYFFNYEKIITARMHTRGNDDMDNKTSDEMTRKNGEQDKQSNHSHLSTSAIPPDTSGLGGLAEAQQIKASQNPNSSSAHPTQ